MRLLDLWRPLMRQLRQGHGWRAARRALIAAAVAMTALGIGTDPAQADPNPVDEQYDDPSGWPVVWDENGDRVDDNCDPNVAPTEDYTVVYPYPFDPARDDYPVVVWANGTSNGANPTCSSAPGLENLASWGFVVVAPNEGQTGSGEELGVAIDIAHVLDAANTPTNPFYDKLDTGRIAAAGHSQGAIGAINAALAEPAGVIDSVLALSMPDKDWITTYNSPFLGGPSPCQVLFPLDCEPLVIAPDATDELDVPAFFARGTGLQNQGCAIDDLFSDQTHVDWRPSDPSASYVFGTVDVDVPEDNPGSWCNPLPFVYYPHLDLRNAVGYTTAWLTYTLGCVGDADSAFTGPTPEIAQNSRWNPPPSSRHPVIRNNLPACP
jgi:pimeloyl-ACP methyl ester carboxylesterase